MAMDFFAHQEQARKRTGRLVAYFAMAIVLIVATLYVVGMLLFNMAEASSNSGQTGTGPVDVVPSTIAWYRAIADAKSVPSSSGMILKPAPRTNRGPDCDTLFTGGQTTDT